MLDAFEPKIIAESAFQAGQDADKWISVDERLPEYDCLVLCEEERCGTRQHVARVDKCGGFFTVGNRFAFDMPKVTHWQPLPPATEEINHEYT